MIAYLADHPDFVPPLASWLLEYWHPWTPEHALETRRAKLRSQIEPSVVLPDALTHTICRHFGVDPDRYNVPKASVQTLADAATPYFLFTSWLRVFQSDRLMKAGGRAPHGVRFIGRLGPAPSGRRWIDGSLSTWR